jgi:hypothetical protein
LAWVRAAPGPGYSSGLLPGNVTLIILYYQVNTTMKSILRATMKMEAWYASDDADATYSYATATSFRGGEYNFTFQMEALSWIDVSHFSSRNSRIFDYSDNFYSLHLISQI